MKNILSVILVFSIVFISLNCNPQKDKPAETPKVKENMQGNTFSGSLVDTKCFSMMPKMNAGNEHTVMGPKGKPMKVKACASACASMGIPVGFLTENGEMYILAVPDRQLSAQMAKNARIQGMIKEGVLIVNTIEVQDGDKWTEVKISYMM